MFSSYNDIHKSIFSVVSTGCNMICGPSHIKCFTLLLCRINRGPRCTNSSASAQQTTVHTQHPLSHWRSDSVTISVACHMPAQRPVKSCKTQNKMCKVARVSRLIKEVKRVKDIRCIDDKPATQEQNERSKHKNNPRGSQRPRVEEPS